MPSLYSLRVYPAPASFTREDFRRQIGVEAAFSV